MNRSQVEILYQVIAFVFAICVHESAHAWTANQCGDPTARMLGRISLNPIKHVDPIGTVLVPLLGMLSNIGFIGWAKPTPVDPHNFRHQIRDDILTSLAGPASNIMLGMIAVFGLFVVARLGSRGPESVLEPIVLLCGAFINVNILLAAFNLIPIPPLDGSHVFRHLLPENAKRAYDMIGYVGILLLFFVGGRLIVLFEYPFIKFFKYLLSGI
ncbi:MAG: site-2 protease family protein [Acidobacteriia bacterium]|nr:site-2 protease family protein [Terriglobia bacterium]